MIKRDKRNIEQIQIWEYKSSVNIFLFLSKNTTINETDIAAITCANFVNLKNLIII